MTTPARRLAVTAALVTLVGLVPANSVGVAATHGSPIAGGSLCGPVTPTAHPQSVRRLRVGVDPGAAGNPLPGPAPKPVRRDAERRALHGLRPSGHVLVVRLNRLFWSGGDRLLHAFTRRAWDYAHHGYDVEVQVRYHPTAAENGHIDDWVQWVRHVTRRLSRNRRLIALTITNEVNFAASANTSDGSYQRAKDALIRGVEAADHALRHDHRRRRVRVGFTFAYRFDPSTDAALFRYLRQHGGARFRRALGFVGLDDYPGTFYPPALPPGDSAGSELASAIATMRECYLPMAGIGRSTPLWITENGFPSDAPRHSEQQQARSLRSMLAATRQYAGSYHVTDYRWFNLRDNDSEGSGMFDQDGLLRDDYSRKPAYSALRDFIRRHGR